MNGRLIFKLALALSLFGSTTAEPVAASPACPQIQGSSAWTNCSGSKTFLGGTYTGQWLNDRPAGEGKLQLPDGRVFTGVWRNGKLEGAGSSVWPDGQRYDGNFRAGDMHGQGTWSWPDGQQFVGEWREDKMHGLGIWYRADGNILTSGLWTDGRLSVSKPLDTSAFPYRRDLIVTKRKVEKKNEKTSTGVVAATRKAEQIKTESASLEAAAETERIAKDKLDQEIRQREDRVAEQMRMLAEFKKAQDDRREAERRLEELKAVEQRAEQERRALAAAQAAEVSIRPVKAAEKRVALVVGNSNYRLGRLRNPRNDADDVSQVLREKGFKIIDLRDATYEQMWSAVRQFGDDLLGADVGLVYYSGHGIESRGANYLIPVDADIRQEDELQFKSLNLGVVMEKMATAAKSINILIVDACRNNEFSRSFRSSSRGLAAVEAPVGTLVAYSTSPGKVAEDGEGRNSPYTKHLVRVIKESKLPVESVFKEVRKAVVSETKGAQTPWENTSLSGDFFFSY